MEGIEQRKRWIVPSIRGELISALGVTEPWRSPVPGIEQVPHYVETRRPHEYRGRRVVVIGDVTIAYTFALEGGVLTLSGGDLEAPTSFARSGVPPKRGIGAKLGAAGGPDVASARSHAATPIVGKWRDPNGAVVEFRPDGSGLNRRGKFRYTASDGKLVFDDGMVKVLLAYRVEGNRLSVESNGETATFTRAEAGTAIKASAGAGAAARRVIVNRTRLTDAEVSRLEQGFRVRILDGDYWYDRMSGAWGMDGGPTLGFLPARLALGGELRADASGGGTNVFINGREIHPIDVVSLQRITIVQPGRYWVDERGNCGYEGNPTPIVNLVQLANAAQARSGGSYHSRSDITGIGSGGDGRTNYVMGKDFSVIIGE